MHKVWMGEQLSTTRTEEETMSSLENTVREVRKLEKNPPHPHKVAWSNAIQQVETKITDETQKQVLKTMLSGVYPSGDIAKKLKIRCSEVVKAKNVIYKMVEELVE
jgi:hypothetical protein